MKFEFEGPSRPGLQWVLDTARSSRVSHVEQGSQIAIKHCLMRRGEEPIYKDPVISFLIQNTIHFFSFKKQMNRNEWGHHSPWQRWQHLGCDQTALHRGGEKTTPKSMKSRKNVRFPNGKVSKGHGGSCATYCYLKSLLSWNLLKWEWRETHENKNKQNIW